MQSSTMVNADRAVSESNWIARHPLISYFSLAIIFTWLLFAPVALGQDGLGLFAYHVPEGAILFLYMLATFGPMSAAFIVTRMSGGRFRELLRRVIQWRVNIVWYLFAIFSSLLTWLIFYSIPMNGQPILLLGNNLGMATVIFVSNLLVGLLLPSLGEETGWRGFALPLLQKRYHPIAATVILGTIHGIWHLPALAVPKLLGPLTLENFAAFTLTAIAGTFVYVWVYNHSNGSILTSIIVHAASNAASSTLSTVFANNNISLDVLPISYRWLNVIAFGTLALLIVLISRGRLGYKDANKEA